MTPVRYKIRIEVHGKAMDRVSVAAGTYPWLQAYDILFHVFDDNPGIEVVQLRGDLRR